MKILIIGGDSRMLVASKELTEEGFFVDTLGLKEGDSGQIKDADVVLLPVPTTRDGRFISCPLTNRSLPLSILKEAKPDTLVLTAGYDAKAPRQADYLKLDSYCLKNAVPTAEGAIAAAINSTPAALADSRVLVIGCGRTGKILADRLCGMRADVTVSARKAADFAYLEAVGIKHIETSRVAKDAAKYDIIFNTVDAPLFSAEPGCIGEAFLFDLSTKGCIDFEKAQKCGLNAVKLPALPAKTAPRTAGKIIARTVTEILKGESLWNI